MAKLSNKDSQLLEAQQFSRNDIVQTVSPSTLVVRMTHSGAELTVPSDVAAMLIQSGDATAVQAE